MSNLANEQVLIMQKKLLAKRLLIRPDAWNMTQVHVNGAKQLSRHNELPHGSPIKRIGEPLSK